VGVDPFGIAISVFYVCFGAYMIFSPKQRERTAQGAARFHRTMWENVRWMDRFADIELWRNLVVFIGVVLILVGVMVFLTYALPRTR
jgi:hypothetical protein